MPATTRGSAKTGWLKDLTGSVAEIHDDHTHIVGASPAEGQPGEDGSGDVTTVLRVGAARSGCIGGGTKGKVVVVVLQAPASHGAGGLIVDGVPHSITSQDQALVSLAPLRNSDLWLADHFRP
jgi:hypothetical protein